VSCGVIESPLSVEIDGTTRGLARDHDGYEVGRQWLILSAVNVGGQSGEARVPGLMIICGSRTAV
jgi:hypothetical protein